MDGAWRSPDEHRLLPRIFKKNPNLDTATQVMGVGLGGIAISPEKRKPDDPMYSDSAMQYCLLLNILDRIKRVGIPDEVAGFVQNPVLAHYAKNIRRRAGVKILDDPDGFLEIDHLTILISIWPTCPVKYIVAGIIRRFGIIWNVCLTEQSEDSGLLYTDPMSPRVEEMLSEEYVEIGSLSLS
ncbi:hypothetical protein F4861DRAFT_551749 [Xylaria intraflava]|nr:hypothetical protein F4861DRAFT_551749 [Xylaria intraflava]